MNRQQNTSRNLSGTTATTTLIYAITVSGSPSKLTAHLQIHIMEKIQPQMVKEYEEQVR